MQKKKRNFIRKLLVLCTVLSLLGGIWTTYVVSNDNSGVLFEIVEENGKGDDYAIGQSILIKG